MIRSKVAFQHSSGGRILATLEVTDSSDGDLAAPFTITAFEDENQLLQQIVLAALSEEETVELVSKVILTVAGRPYENPWVMIQASADQYSVMGLSLPFPLNQALPPGPAMLRSMDLRSALEQTPMPLVLMEGPEHIVTFLNEGFLRMSGRRSRQQILGKPIRLALPEMEGQPFFGHIDRTFHTGKPFIGTAVPGRIYSDRNQRYEDIYLDLIYHPFRDSGGHVCGIICQPNDVTERVLDQQVRDAREAQLFRQWAELDALYRTSPVGMCLIRASDLSIQRINDFNASLVGKTVDDLVGHKLDELYPDHPFVAEVVRRVIREKMPCTLEIPEDRPGRPEAVRTWRWNMKPILDSKGEVESVASATVELTARGRDLADYLDSRVHQDGTLAD